MKLRALREVTARASKTGDWLNAGSIYHPVLDEAVRGYDDTLREVDEDGGIAVVIDEFALGLSQCLKNSKADAQTRRTGNQKMRSPNKNLIMCRRASSIYEKEKAESRS
jgi:hypothetical protein